MKNSVEKNNFDKNFFSYMLNFFSFVTAQNPFEHIVFPAKKWSDGVK